jgi:type IV pilus assembly protein PilA
MIKKQKGFSLIELLIVVAIILIIAAIAIPNLLRARIAANESSAVGSVRTIVTSEVTLIDPVLAAGAKSGYTIAAPGGAALNGIVTTFAVSAVPQKVGQTGQRAFCSDESGVVRFDTTGLIVAGTDVACEALPPLQ